MKDDEELQSDVLEELRWETSVDAAELRWEPSVDAAEIGVTARDGVVTLLGGVPTYAEKVTAERTAKRVRGVKAVANDIEVRLGGDAGRTDTDIAQAALGALKWTASVPDGRIQVLVNRGWVTLEGEVDWHYHKEAAKESVRHLLGVRGVINQIIIKPKASASEVKSRIEAAFNRSAELDARKVHVEAHDGTVILSGDVHSWAERQVAERSAWSAPGVTRVEDHITITPWGTEG